MTEPEKIYIDLHRSQTELLSSMERNRTMITEKDALKIQNYALPKENYVGINITKDSPERSRWTEVSK